MPKPDEVTEVDITGSVERVKGVGFTVRRGEIVGVAGVAGNGQSELLEALAGIRPLTSGRVRWKGRALSEADAVVYNRATGGQYIDGMLKKIGVYPDIERKTVRYESAGEVMQHLAKGGRREIGFGPIPEIMMYTKKGVRYVGPLPAEVQQKNAYVASMMREAANPDGAGSLLRFLASPAAKAALAAGGVE